MDGSGERPDKEVKVSFGQGVQVGDHGRQVNTFIETYIDQRGAALSGARAGIVVVGDVPQKPAAFQPRAELLGVLDRESGPRVSVVFAVTGIRGVGKTQVAAAYARRRITDRWRLVAWVDAGDEASVLAGLAQVAAAAGIGQAGEDARVLAVGVRHWLEADGERRLVVFDNVADLDELRPFLPAGGAAQVVVTSNRRSAAGLGIPVPVDVFTPEEALAYLAARTGLDDTAEGLELAQELGFLPLGLAQAAALIAREHLGYSTYLERLRQLPVADYLGRVEGDAYPHRTAEAIILSLRGVEENDPSGTCAALMDLVSVLAETGVSRRLLHAAATAQPAERESEFTAVTVDASLGRLAEASLVSFSVDGEAVSAHRLVMRVVRERLIAGGRLGAVAAGAVRMLSGMAHRIEETWRNRAWARELIGQIAAVHEHASRHLEDPSAEAVNDLLRLRVRALFLLNDLGDSIGQVLATAEALTSDCARGLGADHPDTLASRDHLAGAYLFTQRAGEAVAMYQQVAAGRELVLGADHRDTLASRDHLAGAYVAFGRHDEAIALYKQVIADRARVLGADHPDTLASRTNLAESYRDAWRADEAVELHEQTVNDYARVRGADHPDTLAARSKLATAYEVAGQPGNAIRMHKQTVADYVRVLGADHPDTLAALHYLAGACTHAGRLDQAIALCEQVVAGRARVLGVDNPQTLASRDLLAEAYFRARKVTEAIAIYERNLTDIAEVLGADHPGTLVLRCNLADTYSQARRVTEAIALYEQAVADRERVLGADNPDTVIARCNLADTYLQARRLDEAIAMYEQAVTGFERVFGADHRWTLASRGCLAAAYLQARRLDEGIAMYEQAVTEYERVLGADHPSTRAARKILPAPLRWRLSARKNRRNQRQT
jgi:tetratricopeptide (TPR) repeat protein